MISKCIHLLAHERSDCHFNELHLDPTLWLITKTSTFEIHSCGPADLGGNNSTMGQVLVWRCQVTSHYSIPYGHRPSKAQYNDVIKWKHFPRYWLFVRGIPRWPVNYPHKGQWRGALMFSLNCAWINGWVNNREAVNLRRRRAHYDITVIVNLFYVTVDIVVEQCFSHLWRVLVVILVGGDLLSNSYQRVHLLAVSPILTKMQKIPLRPVSLP